mmetsp:Transcript_70620/g.229423  ORF Transcript_70620/g.229423 Transcript_70620/m.229423 type:complete len:394 (-) Transcript_70620:370-1551(-)
MRLYSNSPKEVIGKMYVDGSPGTRDAKSLTFSGRHGTISSRGMPKEMGWKVRDPQRIGPGHGGKASSSRCPTAPSSANVSQRKCVNGGTPGGAPCPGGTADCIMPQDLPAAELDSARHGSKTSSGSQYTAALADVAPAQAMTSAKSHDALAHTATDRPPTSARSRLGSARLQRCDAWPLHGHKLIGAPVRLSKPCKFKHELGSASKVMVPSPLKAHSWDTSSPEVHGKDKTATPSMLCQGSLAERPPKPKQRSEAPADLNRPAPSYPQACATGAEDDVDDEAIDSSPHAVSAAGVSSSTPRAAVDADAEGPASEAPPRHHEASASKWTHRRNFAELGLNNSKSTPGCRTQLAASARKSPDPASGRGGPPRKQRLQRRGGGGGSGTERCQFSAA